MRIISGNNKGKKIYLPIDKKTRPLRDMVKESIFNLIIHSKKISTNIFKANVLDLFSGVGSFGLECISRGANNVIFVENYPETLKVLRRNITSFKTKKTRVIDEDCFEILDNDKLINQKFDIIFIDPPYKEKKISTLIEKILKKKILNSEGIIIIHRHKKDNTEISVNFKVIIERTYGISKIKIGTVNQ